MLLQGNYKATSALHVFCISHSLAGRVAQIATPHSRECEREMVVKLTRRNALLASPNKQTQRILLARCAVDRRSVRAAGFANPSIFPLVDDISFPSTG